MRNTKAVVWVSTVLYILIGLAIVGMLLVVIRPKIAEMKDSLTIDQTIQSINKFDELMLRTRQSAGTRLSYELQLSRGNFLINGVGENITWVLKDSAYKYSEDNMPIKIGNIDVLTKKKGSAWQITLTRDYSNSNINITVSGVDMDKTLTPAKIPYSIFIENLGLKGAKQQIDISTG
jgi:type II secretory pathway pseudopilin PulG